MNRYEIFIYVFYVAVIVGAIGSAVLQPYFEAKAFNRCTGGDATYFTAAFTELRVQECKTSK